MFTYKKKYLAGALSPIFLVCALLFLITPEDLISQNVKDVKDTTQSLKKDSIQTVKSDSTKSDIDTLVSYSATDSIIYNIPEKTTTLYGKAKILFKNWKIESEIIKINWATNTLTARGIIDPKDTTKLTGLPVFTESSDIYKGTEVEYNFKTKSGIVRYGQTNIDNGFYKGEKIKKVSDNYYFIKDGIYTTCDAEHPHFCFSSQKMKVIPHEQIIAEPIIFSIADLPVFAIPFAVLPAKGGRASGIIPPVYGDDPRRGKNLRHFGYYWAINDYLDANLTADWYTKGGYGFSGLFQYNLRYYYSGRINFSYNRQKMEVDQEPNKDWRISLNHNQNFNPTTSLNVDFQFLSNSYFQNTSNSYNDLLQQQIVSNATFSKSWEGERSITINANRTQNLRNQEVSEIIPSITFSQSQFYPFRFGKSSSNTSWYEDIGINYNSALRNDHSKKYNSSDSSYNETFNKGIQHSISFNISPKLGYLSLTPSISYVELWYNKSLKWEMLKNSKGDDSLASSEVKGFVTTRYFNFGLSASTRFYGIFKPNIFGITGFRHTVSPSISYNFTPDFSAPGFGFYDRVYDSLGNEHRYSKFSNGIFGGPPQGESQSIIFSLGNVFDIKTAAKDTSQEENKIQLLNINLSTSYNFAADSLRLSDLNLNYRTNIAGIFDLYGNTGWSFYKYNEKGSTINKFLFEDKQLMRLTNFSINLSTTLKGEKSEKKDDKQKKESSEQIEQPVNEFDQNNNFQSYNSSEYEKNLDIPWNLTLNYSYSYSKLNPLEPSKSSRLTLNLGFNLTEKWKFSFSGYYDVFARQFLAPSINIYRDLHCWEMNFSWHPIGMYSGFNFEIRIKAPQLQDIKLTKQGSTRGVFD